MDLFQQLLADATAPQGVPNEPSTTRRTLRPAPFAPPRETIPLDTLPDLIRSSIAAYLAEPSPGYALLLALPPGSGKTTLAVATAEAHAAAGQRVMYAAPRHDFMADLVAIAQRPAWWYEWQPRREETATCRATCRYAPQMARWLDRGYQAMDFCKNPRVCGYEYINTTCPYHAQRRTDAPIIVVQHQHIALHHPLMETASLLIGDELPLSAFLHPWRIPTGGIVVSDAPPDIMQLLWGIRGLCAMPREGGWSGTALYNELGGIAHLRALCAEHGTLRIGANAVEPELAYPEAVESVDYFHLPYLLSLIEQETAALALDATTPIIERVRVDDDGLTLLLRRRPKQLPPHIIWCDATGDASIYETLLGMPVRVVRPHVALHGRVHQVWAALNNKTTVGTTAQTDATAQGRKHDQLRAQIVQILARGNYERPAIISYKDSIEHLAGDFERGHFGAERGTNRLQANDTLIVIGAPQPSQRAILDMAAMLYDTRTRAFTATWSVREIPYTDQPYAWPIGGFWDDPDLQRLIEQHREAEILQAIHRVRPLRRAVDIWLLTNVPIPHLPVSLVSLNDLFGAPVGVDPYQWPSITAFVAERLYHHGRVTTPELATHAGVQLATARKYLAHLAAQNPAYTLGIAPPTGRGKPATCLVLA